MNQAATQSTMAALLLRSPYDLSTDERETLLDALSTADKPFESKAVHDAVFDNVAVAWRLIIFLHENACEMRQRLAKLDAVRDAESSGALGRLFGVKISPRGQEPEPAEIPLIRRAQGDGAVDLGVLESLARRAAHEPEAVIERLRDLEGQYPALAEAVRAMAFKAFAHRLPENRGEAN